MSNSLLKTKQEIILKHFDLLEYLFIKFNIHNAIFAWFGQKFRSLSSRLNFKFAIINNINFLSFWLAILPYFGSKLSL